MTRKALHYWAACGIAPPGSADAVKGGSGVPQQEQPPRGNLLQLRWGQQTLLRDDLQNSHRLRDADCSFLSFWAPGLPLHLPGNTITQAMKSQLCRPAISCSPLVARPPSCPADPEPFLDYFLRGTPQLEVQH
ncbi:uncharacterized protein LOC143845183 isoform X2 [Paroedura picta]|uniref:uncharacterized protein LOC143845183 isoform X2 n=1 Tax=Paroedura picta TaxID=143630 RepID=UPI004056D55E